MGKNVRTHSVTSHHAVKQCQSFLKLSLYIPIPFLKKYFSLYIYVALALNSEKWESPASIEVPGNRFGIKNLWKFFVRGRAQNIRLNLAPSWGWKSKHTCKHCQNIIIFFVCHTQKLNFDFEDGFERNKSNWIGW